MGIQSTYFKPVYEDSIHLSDQLLLPNLVRGNNIFLVTGSIPSYVFKLVFDLANSPEVEPGKLAITVCLAQAGDSEESAAQIFRKLLLQVTNSDLEVSSLLASNLRMLMEERREDASASLALRVLTSTTKAPYVRGCHGVITGTGSENDYVSFVDLRQGDFNSPVKPKKSWESTELLEADEIYGRVLKAASQQVPRSFYYSHDAVLNWLRAIEDSFQSEIEEIEASNNEACDESSTIPSTAQSKADSRLLPEVDDEEGFDFETLDDDQTEYDWEYFLEDFGVSTKESEIVAGHVPPLDELTASLIGPVRSVCKCGRSYLRAEGCPEVIWDRWNTDYRND